MIELPPERANIRPWLVVESGDRWIHASRRFAPELMPPNLIAQVRHFEPPLTVALSGQQRAVILWEVRRAHFDKAIDGLAATRLRSPSTLLLAATRGLADRHHLALSEFGVATFVSHPEHLPRLAPMIGAYFSDSRE